MKKLRLSFLDHDKAEVLSREQLKKIMGGDGSGPAPRAGKTTLDGYCRDSSGGLLGTTSPNICSSADHSSSCAEYSNFDLHRSSCSCY